MGLSGASFHVSYLRFLVSNNLLLFTRPLCKHLCFFFFSLAFFPNISQRMFTLPPIKVLMEFSFWFLTKLKLTFHNYIQNGNA